jgi:alpha-glucan phosphorylase-like protein
MLRALNASAEVYHLNEGHCAFLLFELMRERMAAGESRQEAEAWVRDHCVFTTHTPVLAGHDRFEPELLTSQLWKMRDALHLSDEQLLAYGRVKADDHQEWFTMTVLGLGLTRAANGVSKLNGEVAREQWSQLYPDRPTADVPIGHVTNGIHLPTWTAQPARDFASERLGDWEADRLAPTFWQKIDDVPDADLWALRSTLRRRLIEFVQQHVARQTMQQTFGLDPDALTIGFARRFATYKRAPLLFHDAERAGRILSNADRPVQIIYAGKAHPADEGGKRFIQQIWGMTQEEPFKGRVLFLENYNMEIGRMLVSGCDVWLNNPRRPMEASGTSGQKVSAHGGLNLSILDGWWPEGYNEGNGWAIGDDASAQIASDPSKQDAQDAEFLYQTLETSVVPEFYDRTDGVPARWVARMKNAMRELPAQFSSERMVKDYVEQLYAA